MPKLLVLCPLSDGYLGQMRAHAELVHAPDAGQRAQQIAAHGATFDAVLTIGTLGLTAAEMAQMPRLQLVCALGVGYERIDLAAARARGIALANGAGTNAATVADQAFALLLACVRQIPFNDRACREGVWREALPVLPQLGGKRLGLVGLGAIGRKIAQRGLGFEMAVGYHSRTPKADVPHRFFARLHDLAEWCDALVLAVPGGPETQHLVDAGVLAALGPRGYLVNIGRGSLVDTDALAAALRSGAIAGAGLDVYESEPAPPQPLLDLQANLVLSPHVGGRSPEAVQASVECFIANLEGHFSGRGVLSPI